MNVFMTVFVKDKNQNYPNTKWSHDSYILLYLMVKIIFIILDNLCHSQFQLEINVKFVAFWSKFNTFMIILSFLTTVPKQ